MKTKKHIIIVTDGTEAVQKIAGQIASELKDHQVISKTADDFAATDLLPADIYFFGCEKAKPALFSGLEEVLLHINLVGRPCGLFTSGDEKAVKYLRKMVHDSELDVNTDPFVAGASGAIKSWVRSVQQGS
ncbi:hypothetical protein [Breznakiella homolactica]|uniref:Flavodoxin-like domain-containing protein n=1 Tax=Breznakiella homolactica TaxID=2798577 RepID=A0A7T7XRF9_9SPIR|nr:hypothetical protein [Breznakiella homolactica]QQO11127.1 hypothetical protein JFL75_09490 [Breznakiella homolactica]